MLEIRLFFLYFWKIMFSILVLNFVDLIFFNFDDKYMFFFFFDLGFSSFR